MKEPQLQLLNIKTVDKDYAKRFPAGTPTVDVVRVSGRPRLFGVITIDVESADDLENYACYLVARRRILAVLHAALDDIASPVPPSGVLVLRREIEAALFMAEGKYPGPAAEVLPIDKWRRRNGLAPKYGHLTEAEVRMHVKAMDESQRRVYDPKEPFDSQVDRYVAQLREDRKNWDADEATMMGPLLEELAAGYILDRGETAHMSIPSVGPVVTVEPKASPTEVGSAGETLQKVVKALDAAAAPEYLK